MAEQQIKSKKLCQFQYGSVKQIGWQIWRFMSEISTEDSFLLKKC
jgi:hypothetical protein